MRRDTFYEYVLLAVLIVSSIGLGWNLRGCKKERTVIMGSQITFEDNYVYCKGCGHLVLMEPPPETYDADVWEQKCEQCGRVLGRVEYKDGKRGFISFGRSVGDVEVTE